MSTAGIDIEEVERLVHSRLAAADRLAQPHPHDIYSDDSIDPADLRRTILTDVEGILASVLDGSFKPTEEAECN